MLGQVGVSVVVESEEQPQTNRTPTNNADFDIRVMVDASVILANRRRTNPIEISLQLNSQIFPDTRAGALDAFTPGKGRYAHEPFTVRAITGAGQCHDVSLGQKLVEEIQ